VPALKFKEYECKIIDEAKQDVVTQRTVMGKQDA
jgi:hypothetical protein